MEKKLIVKPNIFILFIVCIDIVAASALVCLVNNTIVLGDLFGWIAIVLLVALAPIWLFVLVRKTKQAVNYFRYFRLILTENACSYTNEQKQTRKFRLADIEQISVVKHKRHTYYEMKLKNPAYIIRIPKNVFFNSAQNMVSFVEELLKKEIFH